MMLTSCNNTPTQDKPKQETPKALEDKSSSFEIASKRGYDDLVESLYNELVTKNTALKKLEDNIADLNTSRNDTTSLFDKFNEKNQAYFNAANRHISEIKDSLLREKMSSLIAANLTKYNASIARHNELLNMMERKQLTIADLHTILKIVKTLPLIERYQHDNLPGTKSMEGYINRQDETIQLADTLSRK